MTLIAIDILSFARAVISLVIINTSFRVYGDDWSSYVDSLKLTCIVYVFNGNAWNIYKACCVGYVRLFHNFIGDSYIHLTILKTPLLKQYRLSYCPCAIEAILKDK